VAQRLLAPPGGKEYGALTVVCRYQADVELVAKVPKEAFYPRPKVSSALVRLDPLPEPRLKLCDPSLFFRVVRAAFGKRRKMLRNALLQASIVSDREVLEQAFGISGIDPRRRGETLSLEEFGRLSDALSSRQRSA
ncbi:MAG: ribosomal RNA small subunit methyltransferase A, partial [Candidatus Methylomirabilales bacterium]